MNNLCVYTIPSISKTEAQSEITVNRSSIISGQFVHRGGGHADCKGGGLIITLSNKSPTPMPVVQRTLMLSKTMRNGCTFKFPRLHCDRRYDRHSKQLLRFSISIHSSVLSIVDELNECTSIVRP